MKRLPTISIVTPTLNATKVLPEYAQGILKQDYPKNKLEIIVADGGSSDETPALMRRMFKGKGLRFKSLTNTLKTGEAGKAVGLKNAKGELVLFLDSDNIIVGKKWLKRMVEPFADPKIVGAEPWQFTARKSDSYITRYTSQLGMSDPFSYFVGNYDHLSILSDQLTGLAIKFNDHGRYLSFLIDPANIPTIGANGALLRRSLFAGFRGDYLFDIDVLYQLAIKRKGIRYAKVKVGLVHLFSGNFASFIRKQYRRVVDYRYFAKSGIRSYPWPQFSYLGLAKFLLACFSIIPLLAQTIVGLARSRDWAFLFHPIACYTTLFVYAAGLIKSTIISTPASRAGWRQTK